MLKKFPLILMWILCLLFAQNSKVGAVPVASGSVSLTQEEKKWLADHPVIKLAPDPIFIPIEYLDKNGRHLGIAADFISLLEERLGIQFQIVPLKTWDEVLEKTKAREVDMWGAVTPTPQRLEYMSFTRPYIELPAVILVRNKVERTLTLEKLKGMKVAVISGYGIHDHMRNHFPEIDLEVVPDISTGLEKVSFGMVDAMVTNAALATSYIEKEGLSNLKISGESGFVYRWGLAARNDWPELTRILDKGIQSISEEERKAIYRKWVGPEIKTSTLGLINIRIVALIVLGLVGILIYNFLLKRKVREQTLDLQNELNRREQVEKLLTGYNEVLASMAQGSNLNIVLDILMNVMEQESDRMLCSILLLDEEGKRLFHGSGPNLPAEYTEAVNGIEIGPDVGSCGSAAYKNIPVMVRDIASDPLWKDIKHLALPHGLRACYSTPIQGSQGNVLGTFAIYYKEICDPTSEDMEIVKSAVQIAKLAIEHNQQDEEVLRTKVEAEQASKAKSEFLSHMSHEFRTPLNAILGFGQLLEMDIEKGMGPDQQKYVEMIMKGGRHLLELVEEILDLSRIESGKLDLKLERVNLQKTAEEVVSFFQPLTKETGVLLENKMTGGAAVFIQADLIRLKQVFINLISNAIKFNHRGGRVVVEVEKNGLNKIFVKISDTGPGIPPEKLDEVFEPFERLEGNILGIEGVGIGLAITKHLIEMMGGAIRLESVLGEGSVFILEFEAEQTALV